MGRERKLISGGVPLSEDAEDVASDWIDELERTTGAHCFRVVVHRTPEFKGRHGVGVALFVSQPNRCARVVRFEGASWRDALAGAFERAIDLSRGKEAVSVP